MSPLLSVIIPFYNGEKYVKSIAESFILQSEKDFELICVDDGSKDNTFTALEEFRKEYKNLNITVVHQENKGVSAARNNGLNYVRGKYISFMDCDDSITPDYVELLKINCNRKFDILVFQQKRIHSNDNKVVDTEYSEPVSEGNMEFMTNFAKNPSRYGVYNMFISKAFFDKYSFKFREGFKYYEDYEFMYRVFCLAKDILVSSHQIYFYILHKGSAMQTFNVDRLTCVRALEELRPFIKNNMPEFMHIFDSWCINRIYWSIMWQACIAFSFKDAMTFAKLINIKERVKPLKNVAQSKVRYSTYLIEYCLPLYIVLVKIYCHSRSAIKRTGDIKEFEKVVNEGLSSSSSI